MRANRARAASPAALLNPLRAGRQSESQREALELPAEVLNLPADPDEAVVVTVAEAWGVVSRLAHCAQLARPQLAWRCQRAGDAIAEILRRNFERSPRD